MPPQVLTPEFTIAAIAASAVVALLGLAVAFTAHRRARRLEAHYRALMTGADGADLAQALEGLAHRLAATEGASTALDRRVADLNQRLLGALQRVHVHRFNAYNDTGGDQSFAVALLDNQANGVLLSGLHGRAGVRVYAKPVTGGRSPYALLPEEEQALAEAVAGAPAAAPTD